MANIQHFRQNQVQNAKCSARLAAEKDHSHKLELEIQACKCAQEQSNPSSARASGSHSFYWELYA